ncbi:MAG: SAM-dependent methyltransferase [Lentisphaeraceae bacterium]|nr:SAM-dependent methyltransferase [Lentisphaeraceae bacterium]
MAANSLGLPDDIPARSLEAVRTADLLIFEEDKPARLVLKTAGVHREYLKYNEQSQRNILETVRELLLEDKTVLYMSDQGCPTLEDPGYEVAKTARKANAKIQVIPGPSSLTAALSACPFSNKCFEFLGFPPREESQRKTFFRQMSGKKSLQIFMDTPYRLKRVLETCIDVFPEEAKGYIALDISGEDENYLTGNFKALYEEICELDKKLNFVMIINPATFQSKPKTNSKPASKKPQRNRRNRR